MKTIIHIGANKTASTLLQRRLFANHPGIAYIGEDCAGYSGIQPLVEALVSKDDYYYDADGVRGKFARIGYESGTSVFVFSSEDILTSRHPSVCAARLAKLMPEAEIVMVIRNQLTTWPSWYINHGAYLKGVPKMYWKRHVRFEDWLEYCFAFPDQTPAEAMNYWKFWEIFGRFFDRSKIRVLMYEDLIQDPASYFCRWAEILGLPTQDLVDRLGDKRERAGYSQRRFIFDKWKSRFPKILSKADGILGKYLEGGGPARAMIPASFEKQILEYYAPGNRVLEEVTGLPLRERGYPV